MYYRVCSSHPNRPRRAPVQAVGCSELHARQWSTRSARYSLAPRSLASWQVHSASCGTTLTRLAREDARIDYTRIARRRCRCVSLSLVDCRPNAPCMPSSGPPRGVRQSFEGPQYPPACIRVPAAQRDRVSGRLAGGCRAPTRQAAVLCWMPRSSSKVRAHNARTRPQPLSHGPSPSRAHTATVRACVNTCGCRAFQRTRLGGWARGVRTCGG